MYTVRVKMNGKRAMVTGTKEYFATMYKNNSTNIKLERAYIGKKDINILKFELEIVKLARVQAQLDDRLTTRGTITYRADSEGMDAGFTY